MKIKKLLGLVSKIPRPIRWMGTRVVILYGVASLFLHVVYDLDQVNYKAQAATLNRLIPDFEYLIKFVEERGKFDKSQIDLEEHARYYRYLLKFRPNDPYAFSMQGFFAYHQGKKEEALNAYQHASVRKPQFVWFNYNLGLIYFQRGQYQKATKYLERVVKADLSENLNIVSSSRVFFPMMTYEDDDFAKKVSLRIKAAYRDAYSLLILSYIELNDYPRVFRKANSAIASWLDENGHFYFYSGLAAFRMKKIKEATVIFYECVKQNPQFVEAFYYLSLCHTAMGQEGLAQELGRRVKQLKSIPENRLPKAENFELRIF